MIDIKELLKAGVHFGHKTSKWSPQMKPFIWGAKNKVHLIDVSKTAILLERAMNFLKEQASQGASFLFVGTKKAAQNIIENTATNLDMPFVIYRWIGGTLSNFPQIKKAMTRLLHLKDVASKSSPHYSKKEISAINKEIERLEKNVGNILNLSYPPAALIVIDAKKEHAAIKEALKLQIPVVALVDTNTDPSGINFIIPSNDDSTKSIEVIFNYITSAIEDGKKIHAEKMEKGITDSKAKATQKTDAVASDLEQETLKLAAELSEEEEKEKAKKAARKVAAKKVVKDKAED